MSDKDAAAGDIDGLIALLRSPATVFYEYVADNGALLRAAADALAALKDTNPSQAQAGLLHSNPIPGGADDAT